MKRKLLILRTNQVFLTVVWARFLRWFFMQTASFTEDFNYGFLANYLDYNHAGVKNLCSMPSRKGLINFNESVNSCSI